MSGTERDSFFLQHLAPAERDAFRQHLQRLADARDLRGLAAWLAPSGQALPDPDRPAIIKLPTPKTGSPFIALLFRGWGLTLRERLKDRSSDDFYAYGEHWTPSEHMARTFGPKLWRRVIEVMNPYVWRFTRFPWHAHARQPTFKDDLRAVLAH